MRHIVGWTLGERCRAGERIAAIRTALALCQLMEKATRKKLGLVFRIDNSSQPCLKKSVAFFVADGIKGQ